MSGEFVVKLRRRHRRRAQSVHNTFQTQIALRGATTTLQFIFTVNTVLVKERKAPIELKSAEQKRDHQCLAQPESLGSVEAERVQVASHATHVELTSATARIRLLLVALECLCLQWRRRDADAVSSERSLPSSCPTPIGEKARSGAARFLAFCLFLTNACFQSRKTLAAKIKQKNWPLKRIKATFLRFDCNEIRCALLSRDDDNDGRAKRQHNEQNRSRPAASDSGDVSQLLIIITPTNTTNFNIRLAHTRTLKQRF